MQYGPSPYGRPRPAEPRYPDPARGHIPQPVRPRGQYYATPRPSSGGAGVFLAWGAGILVIALIIGIALYIALDSMGGGVTQQQPIGTYPPGFHGNPNEANLPGPSAPQESGPSEAELRARRIQISKRIVNESRKTAADLRAAAATMEEAKRNALATIAGERAEAERNLERATASVADHEAQTEAANKAVDVERQKRDDAAAKVQEIREAQHPLTAYLLTYRKYCDAVAANTEANAALNGVVERVREAEAEVSNELDRLTDLEAAAAVAEDAEETAATRLALDNGMADLGAAQRKLDEADLARSDALVQVTHSVEELDDLAEDLATLRFRLDHDDPTTKQLMVVIRQYEDLLLKKVSLRRQIDSLEKDIVALGRISNDPRRVYRTHKQDYLKARKIFLQASKDVTLGEKSRMAGRITLRQLEALRETRRRRKAEQDQVQDLMNAARRAMDAYRDRERALIRGLSDSAKQFGVVLKSIAEAKLEVLAAADAAQNALAPEEAQRVKLLDDAMQARAALNAALAQAQAEADARALELRTSLAQRRSFEDALSDLEVREQEIRGDDTPELLVQAADTLEGLQGEELSLSKVGEARQELGRLLLKLQSTLRQSDNNSAERLVPIEAAVNAVDRFLESTHSLQSDLAEAYD